MLGPYVHRVDPVLVDLGGMYLWWYGLGFALGFLQIYLFLRRRRGGLGLTLREVYTLTLFVVIGVLVGGRLIEVAFDEWPFYRQNPRLIPAYWLGGMATHGLMLGAAAAVVLCKPSFYHISTTELPKQQEKPGNKKDLND